MKQVFYLKIADFVIRITLDDLSNSSFSSNLWMQIRRFYKVFIFSSSKGVFKVDHYIKIKNVPPIAQEKKNLTFANISKRVNKNTTYVSYMIGFEFFNFVIVDILHDLLIMNNGFFLHASANVINNKGVVFLAPSGGGKSTIMSILNKAHPSLGDDTIIIRRKMDTYYCYHTPTVEKNNWIKKNKRGHVLGRIYILIKSKKIEAIPICKKEIIFSAIVSQLWTKKHYSLRQNAKIVALMNIFKSVYYLKFTREKEALLRFFASRESSNI